MASIIGKTIDSYRILEIIGRGGMGVVLKALDINLDKVVALKMIDPVLAKNEEFVRRFQTEAKALAKLENPNIVSVHALRKTEAGFFLVMEYVESKTLSQYLSEKGAFTITEIISITKQVLNAIGHAHEAGIIHRDIKPSNILLSNDGKVKVMDFGLAKVIQDKGQAVTMTQARAGTLYYMSPEQIIGLKNVDNRSDIYSIGMTIYEMVTGRVPFENTDSDFNIQKRIVDGEIPSPNVFTQGIPKQLLNIILKAIDKNPDKRYQNISEMEADLARVESQLTTNVKTKPTAKIQDGKSRHNKNKSKVKFFLLSTLIVAVSLIIIYFLVFNKIDTNKQGEIKNNDVKTNETDNIPLASLTIKTDPPGALVFLEGKPLEITGNSGITINSLKIKKYTITLEKEDYEKLSFEIELKPGDNYVEKKLRKYESGPKYTATVSLSLIMDENGYIYIDNNRIPVQANSTITQRISAQNHIVKFENQNGIVKEISTDGKNQKDLVCYFKHDVNIQTLDESERGTWATVYVDDKIMKNEITGESTQTPAGLTLTSGTYKIYVKRTGYQTLENPQTITISPSFSKKTIPLVFHIKK
ncbi:protein kinase [bacterium BMS3Abin03]|nr:protein kinase [bacterium BMS3Abin03]